MQENQRKMEGNEGLKESTRKIDQRRNDGNIWRKERIMGKGRTCNRGGEKQNDSGEKRKGMVNTSMGKNQRINKIMR